MDPTDDLLRHAVAAHGLPTDGPALPSAPLPDDQWDRLFARAHRARLQGLLAAAVAAGGCPATGAQADAAFAAQADAMASAVRLEQALLEVVDRLEAAGIAVRALKGTAHAHLAYPDPSWRCFGDVDLLVRSDDVERARDLLVVSGGRRRYPEPRPGFDRRFGKGMCIVEPSGVEIDVHRTLCLGPFGLTIDLEELFAGVERFALGGRELTALDGPRRFLHACVHAVVGRATPGLAALRDVAQTVPGDRAGRHDALELADRWQVEVLVARAVIEARAALAWTPPTDLADAADRFVPRPVDRSRLAASSGAGRSSASQALAALRVVPGVRGKVAFAVAVGWPSGLDEGERRARRRRGVELLRRRAARGRA